MPWLSTASFPGHYLRHEKWRATALRLTAYALQWVDPVSFDWEVVATGDRAGVMLQTQAYNFQRQQRVQYHLRPAKNGRDLLLVPLDQHSAPGGFVEEPAVADASNNSLRSFRFGNSFLCKTEQNESLGEWFSILQHQRVQLVSASKVGDRIGAGSCSWLIHHKPPLPNSHKPSSIPWETACAKQDASRAVRTLRRVSQAARQRYLRPIALLAQHLDRLNLTAARQPHATRRLVHILDDPDLAPLAIAAKRAARMGVARLADDLHRGGVFCGLSRGPSASEDCSVELLPFAVDHRLSVRICVPPHAATSRVCEPYGELWQQIGSETRGACAEVSLLNLARWWQRLRVQGAFMLGPDDPHLSELAHKKPFPRKRTVVEAKVAKNVYNQRLFRWLSSSRYLNTSRSLFPRRFPSNDIFETASPSPGVRHGAAGGRGRCAFVGSGHSLRCGGPRGQEIDAHEVVVRANRANLQTGTAHGKASLAYLSAQRVGARTDVRINCLDGSRAWGGAEEVCAISYSWWRQAWGTESFNNVDKLCCVTDLQAKRRRSSYHLKTLEELHQGTRHVHGLPTHVVMMKGVTSEDPVIDALLESSGGNGLQAAISLCNAVDVYGVGLLSTGADNVYAHYWDAKVGQCFAASSTEAERLRLIGMWRPHGFRSLYKWQGGRVRTELLMHVLHTFGIIEWIRD